MNNARSLKHVSFRESKLTKLLYNSLTVNSKTLILCTISLKAKHLNESISTLRFGVEAKKIEIKFISRRNSNV